MSSRSRFQCSFLVLRYCFWILLILGRVYRYYFLRREYDVDILRQAVKLLEGEHDFRNFCRIDAVNVCDFTRTIFQGDVVLVKKG